MKIFVLVDGGYCATPVGMQNNLQELTYEQLANETGYSQEEIQEIDKLEIGESFKSFDYGEMAMVFRVRDKKDD